MTAENGARSYGDIFKENLSGKKFNAVIAASAKIDGERVNKDLSEPVADGAEDIEPIYADSPEGEEILRHSTAHVMAAAVKRLFPEAKIAIGPAINKGFYYDFDVSKAFAPEDLEKIEKEMAKIAAEKIPFAHKTLSREEAVNYFRDKGEIYKVELAEQLPSGEAGIYSCGEFTDLCKGPHVPHTGFATNFKLLSLAGAYWRGDEKNKMLSRVYGTAFADKKSLDEHLRNLEEAKKRDHRKLGKELQLFDFEERVAPGMVFWMPKGMLVRTILEDFWRKEHLRRGYELVQGPQLLRVEAWKKSGHYDHYKNNMYFTEIDKDPYGIKPMNCVGHMLIYGHDLHSYRDLPKRFFELGVVHRHEKSGVLHGLMRVRQFTQDDAHIICALEDLKSEILNVIDLVNSLMNLFDFKYKIYISTRPEDSIGTDEAWEAATSALIKAVEGAGLPYEINEGDGAFYGPKIDVKLLDSLEREWQCSTIQVDFTLPERFDLTYVAKDGEKRRPVMVHRAIMGSVERFIGILLEHYAGALPTWLAPEQARILTVTSGADEAAKKAEAELRKLGIRVNADLRNEKLGFKVREARMAKTPYCLIIGEKEAATGVVSVRPRVGDDLGQKTLAEAAELIRRDAEEPFKKGGMSYSFA
ncbi:MAG: threonine--tRNA ligase [Desulfovibrio sp.]|nr:threonine--tRNA ligase [Desulfovibrio sp.]